MSPKKKRVHRKKLDQPYSPTGRKTRKDWGIPRLTTRDRFALTWIGEQYAMRFDQVQELLGRRAGHGATYEDEISESATYNVLAHWKKGKWVITRALDETGLLWVWLTKKGLTALSLPYQYHNAANLGEEKLKHLYAITDVRLEFDRGASGIEWNSERMLLQGTHRRQGSTRMHRPDAVLLNGDQLIAIEVELSRKAEPLLSGILATVLSQQDYHGYAYHALKAQVGEEKAKAQLPQARRCYTNVYYFARPTIRRYIRRVRSKLFQRGILFSNEAERISVLWYPLAVTNEELAQEQDEDCASMDLEGSEELFLEDQWREYDA